MACQSAAASQLMSSAMGYVFQGQGQLVAANYDPVLHRDLLDELVDRGHRQITRAWAIWP
jgi:hypothetical protein